MTTKNAIAILTLFVGESIIIASMHHFFGHLPQNVFYLNCVVASIIYILVFADLLFPWINLKDRSQRAVGSIGIRWFVSFLYAGIAGVAMLYMNSSIRNTPINSQLLVHSVLLFLLMLGMFMAFSSSDKVHEVFIEETTNRGRVDEMKRHTKELCNLLQGNSWMPADLKSRITELHENMRFLSPSNNPEAITLETSFCEETEKLCKLIRDGNPNGDAITLQLSRCESVYRDRKNTYSN